LKARWLGPCAADQKPGDPGGQSGVALKARWLGPCAADQKPGDMIMPNGTKMNILNMPKARGQPGTAGAPPNR